MSIEWGIHPKEQTIEIVDELRGALDSKNPEEVRKILQDPKTLHSLVEGGKYDEAEKSFNLLLQDKFGPKENILTLSDEKIISVIKDYDVPEQLLLEIIATEFHKHKEDKNGVAFYRIMRVVLENESSFQNGEMVSVAKHHLASWKSSAENNKSEAVSLNKDALEEALKNNDLAFVAKITFGLTFNKDLKPADKIDDYNKISNKIKGLSNEKDLQYLVLRFKIEEARERMKLAERQKNDKNLRMLRLENLIEAKKTGEEVLDSLEGDKTKEKKEEAPDNLKKKAIEHPKLRNFALDIVKLAKVYINRESQKIRNY